MFAESQSQAAPREVTEQFGLAHMPWQFLGNGGGFSGARFWRSHSMKAFSGGDSFCLRRWPSEHPTRERLEYVHRVLFHVQREGFSLAPIPLRARDGRSYVSFAGYFWQVEPWARGEANFFTEPSTTKVTAGMRELALFHQGLRNWPTGRPVEAPCVRERLARVRDLMEDLETWRIGSPRSGPDFARDGMSTFVAIATRHAAQVRSELEELIQQKRTLRPAIRDIWTDHVFYLGDEVSAVIDFGALREDWQWADAARLLGSFDAGSEQYWQAGVDAYSTAAQADAAEVDRVLRIFDRSNALLGPYHWLRWLVVEGRRFDDLERVRRRFRTGIDRLERLG